MAIVGVIGGGQLARMMQPAAINLGIELRVFAESEESSAHQAAYRTGDYNSIENLLEFSRGLDALTFDHEHVPQPLLAALEQAGVKVRPGSQALIHAQNKLVMRQKLEALGLPQPKWTSASSAAEIESFIAEHGPKIIVKTPIGGYDGKGVRVVSAIEQVSDWLSNLQEYGGALLLEQKVEFTTECAQLSARTPSNQFVTWPLAQTIQSGGVCSEVVAPFGDPGLQGEAIRIAETVSRGLGVVGVLAVEMFVTSSGELLINELAMRPHNSGHFTQDASVTSQFEQHLRAVLDMPLGGTEMTHPHAVMINLLGVDSQNNLVDRFPMVMKDHPHIKFHFYQKAARAGRKMGHLNLFGEDAAELMRIGRMARDLIYNQESED